jgi:PAS domain S-box-containing protein
MELLVACIVLLLCCAALLWDRHRLQRRAQSAGATAARFKSIADELEQKRRFLERILDSIGDPVFVKDSEHRYVYVNEAKCRLTGQSRDAIIGRGDYDIARPKMDEVDVFLARDEIVLRTGQEDINEEALTGADGAERTVLTKKSLYVDDTGRRCVVGVIRDITEQKHAEEALKRSQAAYLAEAQRLSKTGSFGWNVSTGEIFWSDETFRIYGYDLSIRPSTALVLERVHPEDAALVKSALERAAREKADIDYERRHLMPDGSVKYLRVVERVIADEPGNLQFAGAVMDVTAAKQAQEQLRNANEELRKEIAHRSRAERTIQASEERWRRLFETSSAGMALLTLDGVYMAVNPAFQRILGYTEDELKSRSVVDITHPDERETSRQALVEFERGLRQEYHVERRYIRKDGKPVWVNKAVTMVPATEDAPPLLQAIYVDITERKRAEEKLQRAQAELAYVARVSTLGEITASIAHEVSQPLGAITTDGEASLRFLNRDPPHLGEVRDALKRMIGDGKRAAQVVQHVRALCKRGAPQLAPVELNALVAEAVQLVQREIASHRVVHRIELAPRLPCVLGDKVQLQQVMINLIINGIQAMAIADGRPRELVIRSQLDEKDQVVFSVQDSGTGISPENASRLFEAFFTTKSDGMGMGLSICRTIIEAHGGRVWASSDPGPGATFLFRLPAIEEGEDCGARVPPEEREPDQPVRQWPR